MPDEFSKGAWSNYQEKLVQTQARRAELRARFENKDDELRVLEEKLANMVQLLKDAERIMEEAVGVLEDSEELPPKIANSAVPHIGPDSKFYGKPLPECAVVVIREAGRPLTEEEILVGLRAGGVQIVSQQPLLNVRRSMARRNDILYTKNRKWAVIETPIDSEQMPKGQAVNKFSKAHAESTRNGIEAAKARGVAWGRSATITPEKEKVIAELRSLGMQAKEIIEAIGVSRTTYFNYLKERGLSKKYELSDEEKPEKPRLVYSNEKS